MYKIFINQIDWSDLLRCHRNLHTFYVASVMDFLFGWLILGLHGFGDEIHRSMNARQTLYLWFVCITLSNATLCHIYCIIALSMFLWVPNKTLFNALPQV